ncbi:hypothetical protein BBA71_13245 [Acetobacter pasteurianus]|nr:hypothetical protein BBA71_13245 [Acetobacter pasteurianus]
MAFSFTFLVPTLVKADEPDAFAQQNKPHANPTRPVTIFEPVPESSSDLINGGAQVLSADIGMGGPTVFLQKDGKYILCGIRPAHDSLTNDKDSTSECYRLN